MVWESYVVVWLDGTEAYCGGRERGGGGGIGEGMGGCVFWWVRNGYQGWQI